MSKNRFDLEQEIMDCWHITDEIKLIYEYVMDGENDTDTVANMLLGLETLYNLKFDRTFRTFEDCVHNGEFNGYTGRNKSDDLNWY